MLPGRLLATSLKRTVPVASSTTWRFADPRAAFVAWAQVGTSFAAVITATNVLGGGWAADAMGIGAATDTAATPRTTKSFFMSFGSFYRGCICNVADPYPSQISVGSWTDTRRLDSQSSGLAVCKSTATMSRSETTP